MYNRLVAAILLLTSVASIKGQDSFKYEFYGRIRADLFYNSRENNETVDGLFYMYPKDNAYDSDGDDLNGGAQGSMYALYTRVGVDIKGPEIGGAKTSAKIEGDFRGTGSNYAVLRMRHAYVNLDWGKSSVLIGQTWHPLFGEVSPSVLNLSTGAPFQPFSRCPQVKYIYSDDSGLKATAVAAWQMQFNSAGPEGKSHKYLKDSNVPELFVGIDYASGGFTAGLGGEMLTLCPRRQSTVGNNVYKVNERVTSFSAEAHAKYTTNEWQLSGKTTLANNLTQLSMLGGFGVTSVDQHTGEREYTPFRHSMTWLNFTCGHKWQPGVFIGYLKNLGTGKSILDTTYGVGLDVDQIFASSLQLSYNLPCWKFGAEVTSSTAWYGKNDFINGKVFDTHSVNNIRLLLAAMYIF